MQEIETRTVVNSLIEEGILKVVVKENINLTLEDARENYNAAVQLTNSKRFSVLVEGHDFVNIDKDAREFSSTAEAFENTIAMAIVVRSLSTRLIGLFLLRLNKCNHKTDIKLFKDSNAALSWIKEKMNEDKIRQ
ncbi:MAG: hypothetical protein Q7W13_12510 [Bacteroidia bacterium]|nr:hypothetical protein [Bacteroidia bacterium]